MQLENNAEHFNGKHISKYFCAQPHFFTPWLPVRVRKLRKVPVRVTIRLGFLRNELCKFYSWFGYPENKISLTNNSECNFLAEYHSRALICNTFIKISIKKYMYICIIIYSIFVSLLYIIIVLHVILYSAVK